MPNTISVPYLKERLKQARFYEFCKETERVFDVLGLIWTDLDKMPDVSDLPDDLACEFLLICGNALSFHGMHHQKKESQELASDILTRAQDIAIKIGNREFVAEAEKQIAIAYWRVGNYDNALAYSNMALSHYSEEEQKTEKVCLLTKTNLIMIYVRLEEFELCEKLVNEIEPHVLSHKDEWVKAAFLNHASGFCIYTQNYERAIQFLLKAVDTSVSTKNNWYLGSALNNLAFTYINSGNYEEAFKYVNQAVNLFARLNQPFARAQVLETKAQIYLFQGKLKEALITIDESIDILRRGENYPQFCESMWTRTLVLAKSGEKNQATYQFAELVRVAQERLSQADSDKYVEKFNQFSFISGSSNYYDKIDDYQRFLLSNALREGNNRVTRAAEILGMKHQTLSALLKKFPDLCEIHNIKKRLRRGSSLMLGGNTNYKKISNNTAVVRLECNRLAYLNLSKNTVVQVELMDVSKLDLSKPVAVKGKSGGFHCGFLVNDLGMLAFGNGQGDFEKFYVKDEIKTCGQVVSYYNETTKKFELIK